MPQIVSLLPTAPALPAAAPAPAPLGAATPSTVGTPPGTQLPADPTTSPNFLAQFKSALKSIANVVVLPQLAPHAVADQGAGPLMSAVEDHPAEAPKGPDSEKHNAGLMPELLVQLGFAVVPAVLPVPAAPQPAATGSAAPATQPLLQAVALGQQPQLAAQPLAPQVASAQLAPVLPNTPIAQPPADNHELKKSLAPDAQVAQALPAANVAQALPDAQIGQPLTDLYFSQSLLPIQAQPAPTAAALSPQPLQHLKPSDQPQSTPPLATAQATLATAPDLTASVLLQPAPLAHQATAGAPTATPAPVFGMPQQGAQSGSQSSSAGSDHGRHAPDKVASIVSDGTTVQNASASDAAMVAAAAATASAATGPQTMQVGPSQVVSQIANHADLIRLPGNKGLHIQLHPDDLGGVQVTVRYSPGGGVELHINADHAETGALVQAGWTELRDALAGHGISADRLMMSVTSPTAAGQADLSGGGGNRPDSSSYSSNPSGQANLNSADSQGQGQGRQDGGQQRTSPSWRGGLEPVSSSDDLPRVATTTAGPSRIDYRV